MMSTIVRASLIVMVALFVASRPAFAQLENLQPPPAPQQPQPTAPEEPGIWTGSASAGLSLTSGNTDTLSFNLGFDLTRDPKTRNLMKARGLYLRSDDNNNVTANRATSCCTIVQAPLGRGDGAPFIRCRTRFPTTASRRATG